MAKKSILDSGTQWQRFAAKVALSLLFASLPTSAGEYHKKDMLVGERATGLGGAFVAISDDPSGIYYNPAGILFSLENYLSVSSNAYSTSNQQFQEVFPGQNYSYQSRGLVPSLFGFTQTFGKSKFGFAVVTPASDATDQKDEIRREAAGTTPLRLITRNFYRQDTTYLIGPAYAFEVADNLALGISLFGMARFVKAIDNTLERTDPNGTDRYFLYQLNFNRTSFAVLPKIGLQYMPIPKWSIGVTLSRPYDVGGSSDAQTLTTKRDPTTGQPVVPTGNATSDFDMKQFSNLFYGVPTPLELSIGSAYFFSKTFLVTAQLDVSEGKGYLIFPLRAMANWSIGSEYYFTEGFAARAGLYSNNTIARPLVTGGTDQAPFVNMVGASLGVSLYRPGSSLTISISSSHGSGEGQAFAEQPLIQKVSQSNFTVYLGGSYQL